MNKNAIKKFAIDARKKLIASVSDRAGMLGITPEGCSEPISKGVDFEVYKTVAGAEVTLGRTQCEQRRKLKKQIESRGFDAVVEEVAYTWFNRICAIRFMEVNDYLPTRVRVLSSEKAGKNEPDIVTQAPDVDLGFTDKEREYVFECKVNNKLDELFKFLFLKQCNVLAELMPELFEEVNDYSELLINLSYIDPENVMYMLVHDIDEADFDIQREGQVEVIGWLYQYYISAKHDEVVNVRKKTALSKDDMPAATQIFTPDWVVKYMVDNSLGKLWNGQSIKLDYYISSDEESRNEPDDITMIKFLDPCMGSGHILAYAFDVFMEIYKARGYSERDAAKLIIENNLFGLDLDKRAYQLAYFSLLMKARKYNRRILGKRCKLNLAYVEESNALKTVSLDKVIDNNVKEKMENLIIAFNDAREYGSLLHIAPKDYNKVIEYIDSYVISDNYDFEEYELVQNVFPILKRLAEQAILMCKRYEVVCTNPPYTNKFNHKLEEFIDTKYSIAKGDIFSAFMVRNLEYCVEDGYSAMMTPHVWMFIKSYEKLREFIIENKTVSTLIHLAKGAFYSEAAVDICTFVLRNKKSVSKGKYLRLEQFKGDMDVQKEKVLYAISNPECDYVYERDMSEFCRIEGMPFSYWVPNSVYLDFENGTPLKIVSPPRQGMATTNNDRFLRLWFEIDFSKIGFGMKDEDMSAASGKRYFPYNKGGEFRRWYGNNYYVVNFQNHGKEVCDYIDVAGAPKFNHKNRVINRDYYFKKCITWSDISADFSGRYCPEGFIFDIKGSSGFPPEDKVYYILGLLNSKLTQAFIDILNPTITTQVGDMARIPVLYGDECSINEIVKECVSIAKRHWDYSEISWDFKKHPLLEFTTHKIEDAMNAYENQIIKDREALIRNEELLNAKFIEIYGLQEYLTPEIKPELIGLGKLDRAECIKSLISYFVGCLLGRYSLKEEGLILAGGELDTSRYGEFVPDLDNIIPITDDEYFLDDIISRFYEFISLVFGEEYVEENFQYIAECLSKKGGTSREIIRKYFLTDFFKYHSDMYSASGSGKRPIYWMFDAGKENSFKALTYIHRFTDDTLRNVRTEYLHKVQAAIEVANERATYTKVNSASGTEKSKATQSVAKYAKQLAEIATYDEALAHVINARMSIELDDGIKSNYAKFQGIEISHEGKKAEKIDLLAKIK